MGMRIATNIAALNARKNMYGLSNEQQTVMERLSSGIRINKSSDDAAGLAISENLKAQIRGFRQANRNANDGISLVQVAEGGLSEITNMLVRLRELAVQSASDTIGDRERGFTNIEYQQLKSEIDRVAHTTTYNGTPLLTGGIGPDGQPLQTADGQPLKLDIQIGLNNNEFNDRITFDTASTDSTLQSMHLNEVSVATKEQARNSLNTVDDAINRVNGMRANFGAMQNRLQTVSQTLMVSDENLSAANSRIRDADIAEESSKMAKNNVLMQAATAVLGQANQSNQLALKLLG
ncbi:MAG: flagellin FliC [Bdellovibrio sp.]|nr:flagellin FliC [Bdellovibrio sp.]